MITHSPKTQSPSYSFPTVSPLSMRARNRTMTVARTPPTARLFGCQNTPPSRNYTNSSPPRIKYGAKLYQRMKNILRPRWSYPPLFLHKHQLIEPEHPILSRRPHDRHAKRLKQFTSYHRLIKLRLLGRSLHRNPQRYGLFGRYETG